MRVYDMKSLVIRGASYAPERMQALWVDWDFSLALLLVSLMAFRTQSPCLWGGEAMVRSDSFSWLKPVGGVGHSTYRVCRI